MNNFILTNIDNWFHYLMWCSLTTENNILLKKHEKIYSLFGGGKQVGVINGNSGKVKQEN